MRNHVAGTQQNLTKPDESNSVASHYATFIYSNSAYASLTIMTGPQQEWDNEEEAAEEEGGEGARYVVYEEEIVETQEVEVCAARCEQLGCHCSYRHRPGMHCIHAQLRSLRRCPAASIPSRLRCVLSPQQRAA